MSAVQVHERKDTKKKSWSYRFEAPRVNGERQFITKSGFKTKKEADEAGNKAYCKYYANSAEGFDEIDPNIRKLSFQDYIEQHWWPLNYKKWKTTTALGYKKKLDNYLIPEFGRVSLEAMRSERLQFYFDRMYLDEDTAICTVNDLRSMAAQIFKFAVRHRHLRYSPMDAVSPPNRRVMPAANKKKQVRDVIPKEILDKIFERFPEGSTTYIPNKLCLLAGLRLGEAYGLAWHDVDFDNHWIYVTRQVQMREKGYIFNDREKALIKQYPELSDFKMFTCNPKDESKRVVPMSEELEELLHREYERQQKNRMYLGNLYKKYYYTKATDPYGQSRNYLNFNIKRISSLDDYEDGFINEIGAGFPIDFVNVRDDGTIISSRVTQHLSWIIHGHSSRKKKSDIDVPIYKDFNVHSLRHTFASNLRASGVPGEVIQELMGHKSLEVTQTYMHITADQFNNTAKIMHSSTCGIDDIITAILQRNFTQEELLEITSRINALVQKGA